MLSDWRVGRRSQNLAGRSFWERSEQNFLNSLGNTDEKVFTVCGFEGTTFIFLDSSMVEHSAVNRGVVGSSPTRGVFSYKAI